MRDCLEVRHVERGSAEERVSALGPMAGLVEQDKRGAALTLRDGQRSGAVRCPGWCKGSLQL